MIEETEGTSSKFAMQEHLSQKGYGYDCRIHDCRAIVVMVVTMVVLVVTITGGRGVRLFTI